MIRPRNILFLLCSLVAALAFGRVLFECGVALVHGNVHSALLDVPLDWILIGIFAAWIVGVSIALNFVGGTLAPRRYTATRRRS